ncbi:MAG: hypothetical protein CL878_03790 [Dehalococcoidia bacterium]|nr:hypothetical protein [Dehalococcoidia bacterium]
MSVWDELAGAVPVAWDQINMVDAALLLVTALFILNGIRRGLVSSVAGLTALGVSVVLAIKFYRPVAELILEQWQMSTFIANVAGFFAVLIPAQILFAFVLAIIASLLRPLRPWLGPLIAADHLLGVLPGFAQGIIVAALLLTPLHILPLSGTVQQTVEESALASYLTRATAAALPQLETLFGQAIHNTMVFRSRVVVEDGETIRFGPFPLPDLQNDPAAESGLLELVNAARARESLPPLVMDPDLREVARAHSAEMFRLSYFSHRSPVTGDPADRIRSNDIPYQVAGENLAYAPTVEVAHSGLMNSPGHRRNILATEYGRIGIGVVSGGVYGKMFTQNFTN